MEGCSVSASAWKGAFSSRCIYPSCASLAAERGRVQSIRDIVHVPQSDRKSDRNTAIPWQSLLPAGEHPSNINDRAVREYPHRGCGTNRLLTRDTALP